MSSFADMAALSRMVIIGYIAKQTGRETHDLWAYFCAVQASKLEADS